MYFRPSETLKYVLSLYLTGYVLAESSNTGNQCTSKPNCHECIQTPSCAWCFDPMDKFDRPRCFQPAFEGSTNDQCPEEYTYNPDNVKSIISELPLTKAHSKSEEGGTLVEGMEVTGTQTNTWSGQAHYGANSGASEAASGQVVQITPQRLSLKLRARQSYNIFMSYTQAEDYPVDLYYLMDLSKSMSDDKDKLSDLGDLLVESMQNITSKFALGFGSFVDKVVMPYVSTVPENLEMPCPGCAAPYGFQNMMPLSADTYKFSHMVKSANVSGNLDAPEGGFDAIMQAVACRTDIGWREKARRLLVFSTDAGFHYAGDGKLGGIVKPNDGKCHLNTKGYYNYSSLQDYPSISQINYKVKKNAINVIFAVTAEKLLVYQELQKHIEGSSVGKLSNDSGNVVTLIKEQYQQISSTIEMRHNASSALNIKFFSNCLKKKEPLVNTNKCGNMKVGNVVQFMIQIEVIKCPKDPKDWHEVIEFYPVGLNETLVVDLTMLCCCPCEQPGNINYEENSPHCNNHGTYKCGVCECNFGSFGQKCQCSTDSKQGLANVTTGCIQPGSPRELECSGRGSCICNKCECEPRGDSEHIYGKYCQCDDFSCERHEGLLCSGPTHGTCDCGRCICKTGWAGENCACRQSEDTCYAPGSTQLCSGHGTCVCGKCLCTVTEESRYSGTFCEKCPTCTDRCAEFKDCVHCLQYEENAKCPANCTFKLDPQPKEKIVAKEEGSEVLCPYYDGDCRYAFVYYFEGEEIAIRVQEKMDCPKKVFLVGIILGVVAAIVLMGLAIVLLWKLATTIHDRREFAKFERERMMAKWDTGENPIYKQATSTFKNPTYAGKS